MEHHLQKNYRSRLYVLPEGINTLLTAGDPLLTLVTTLDEREVPQDRAQFKDNIVFELNIFSRQLKLEEYDEKLARLSQQIMIFFIEQRLRRMAGWDDFVLSKQDNLNLNIDWFKEILAKVLAKQIDSLPFVEFVYTWLKTNPWVLESDESSAVQSRDMSLLITGKLYNLIQSKRPRNSTSLLVGNWNITGGSVIRTGKYNLGSPFWWLFSVGVLLVMLYLMLGINLWCHRKPIADTVAPAALVAAVSSHEQGVGGANGSMPKQPIAGVNAENSRLGNR